MMQHAVACACIHGKRIHDYAEMALTNACSHADNVSNDLEYLQLL